MRVGLIGLALQSWALVGAVQASPASPFVTLHGFCTPASFIAGRSRSSRHDRATSPFEYPETLAQRSDFLLERSDLNFKFG